MSTVVTNNTRSRGAEHFEPEAALDPHEQRRMRGHLEQIDYATFAANREILGRKLGHVDLKQFQHLAVAAAHARAHWVAAALALAETQAAPNAEQIARLEVLRKTFEELSEAYEALRRMVERGYLRYHAAA